MATVGSRATPGFIGVHIRVSIIRRWGWSRPIQSSTLRGVLFSLVYARETAGTLPTAVRKVRS